tara:strand:- start:1676 stop:2206 length:531 start_codon:yes stop_codon:yes gene_type:complete
MIKTFEVAPLDVQKDIDLIYDTVIKKNGRRSNNYLAENLKEPVVGVTVRYNEQGNPIATARMLSRSCYKDSVRVFDRYALIEGSTGLIPSDYDGLFKKSSSEMLDQQTNFCLDKGFKCIFISMELRVEKTLKRVIKGHNKYSKHLWHFDGPHYVTYEKSQGGLQYIGYTGNKFERK